MGIEVLPPDVNESRARLRAGAGEEPTSATGWPRSATSGEGAVQQIIDGARPRRARSRRSRDFCRKVEPGGAHEAGAGEPDPRRGVRLARVRAAGAARGLGEGLRADRWPSARPRPPGSSRCSAAATAPRSTIDESVLAGRGVRQARRSCAWRRRCSASSSPTTRCSPSGTRLAAQTTHEIAELREPGRRRRGDGRRASSARVGRKYTKRGEPYAQFRLEGLAGGVGVVAFPVGLRGRARPDRDRTGSCW